MKKSISIIIKHILAIFLFLVSTYILEVLAFVACFSIALIYKLGDDAPIILLENPNMAWRYINLILLLPHIVLLLLNMTFSYALYKGFRLHKILYSSMCAISILTFIAPWVYAIYVAFSESNPNI